MKLLLSVTLFAFLVGQGSATLEYGDSVCKELKTRKVSRFVPYIETYRKRVFFIWRTMTRVNYRWEFHTEYYTEESCCNGYHLENGYICKPTCDTDCNHGHCTGPNRCSCDIGYKISVTTLGQTCIPECIHGCVHGTCTAPNTCTCDKGYERGRFTHICVPSCNPQCGMHSTCITPNMCHCNPGYEYRNVTDKYSADSPSVRCEPVCSPECGPHSTCVEPDLCQCQVGYESTEYHSWSFRHYATPTPVSAEDTCQPICDPPCGSNSTCVEPNVCQCEPGFAPLTGNMYLCEPICIPSCGENGSCVGPNECRCDSGYELVQKRDKASLKITSNKCSPICDPPCGIRGDCLAPNTCSCEENWKINGAGDFKYCEPNCDPPCGADSACVRPNVCTCFPGYEVYHKTSEFTCRPVCAQLCVHGYCQSPDFCECDPGFELDETNRFKCDPKCGNSGCTNGKCSAPDICTCYDGYNMTSKYLCEPFCKTCDHGKCVAPNYCVCDNGYEMTLNGTCVPTCYGGCKNGICVGPNNCVCNPGFEYTPLPEVVFDLSSISLCQPSCSNGCQNGTCVAPDTCMCNAGYEKNDNGNCAAHCGNRCSFGECIAPDECKCNEGYISVDEREGELCQPFCEESCLNGTCIKPGVCQCNEGYLQDIFNASLCKPICEPDCGHGECIAPNDCRCFEGYVRDNASDVETTTAGCINPCGEGGCGDHGICDSQNRMCHCFYGWSGKNCGVATLCGIIREENDVDLGRWIPDRNGTNDTIGNLESVNWQGGPSCNEKCEQGYANETTGCYRLLSDDRAYNATSIVCFMSATSPCNAANLQSSSNLVYSGIAGTIVVLIIGIAGTAGAVFLVAKRRRKLDCSGIRSSGDNLLEQSEATDSLVNADESSYL